MIVVSYEIEAFRFPRDLGLAAVTTGKTMCYEHPGNQPHRKKRYPVLNQNGKQVEKSPEKRLHFSVDPTKLVC